MENVTVQLPHKKAEGYVIPLGPANLVAIITDIGLVGCGAFDVSCTRLVQLPGS